MGRVVLPISAGITAFVLAITAGIIYAYRTLSASTASSAQSPTSVVMLQVAAVATPTEAPDVSPQEAASIAAKFLNRSDLYSVELADLQGVQTYKVTFSSGDVVFVGLKGAVLSSVAPPPPTVITVTSGGGGGHRHGGGGGGGEGGEGAGEGEHEGGDD